MRGEISTAMTIHVAALFPFFSATVPIAIERASQMRSQIKASMSHHRMDGSIPRITDRQIDKYVGKSAGEG